MDLCERSATELRNLLDRGETSSVDLVRAHLDRIDVRDLPLRAFTQVFRERAIEEARAADDRRRRGEARGPLDGLPVSVKESVDVAGHASTMGVPSRSAHRAERDAVVVEALRRAGAIVLGRTNVAQFLLFHESRNPLFGQSANPWDLSRTPGGSSGGEGAALAAGLSPLGIGTDIGGSIRVPAHFCGVAGLKPTLDRWSNRGSQGALVGQEAVRGQIGPMARRARDLALLMEALDPAWMSEHDPRVPPLPIRDPKELDVGRLRVGIVEPDRLVSPSAAVVRAIDRAGEVLRDRGATILPFVPPRVAEHVFLYFGALSADGGAAVRTALGEGAVDPVIVGLRRIAELPGSVRKVAARIAEAAGEGAIARMLEVLGEKSVARLWQITAALRQYRFELLDALARAQIDVLLATPHATPALPHLGARDFVLAGSASILWNIVQFPAGVVPVTRVRAGETAPPPRGRLERLAAKVDAGSAGLPVGVQVVARPWREDLVLAAMIAIEEGLAADPEAPRTPLR
jgi:fatty acid amide hydrolase